MEKSKLFPIALVVDVSLLLILEAKFMKGKSNHRTHGGFTIHHMHRGGELKPLLRKYKVNCDTSRISPPTAGWT